MTKLLEALEVGDPVVLFVRGEPVVAGVVSENELDRVTLESERQGTVTISSDLILTGDVAFRLLDFSDELRTMLEAGGPS